MKDFCPLKKERGSAPVTGCVLAGEKVAIARQSAIDTPLGASSFRSSAFPEGDKVLWVCQRRDPRERYSMVSLEQPSGILTSALFPMRSTFSDFVRGVVFAGLCA